MALTEHQRHHLNAAIADVDTKQAVSNGERAASAGKKGMTRSRYDLYLASIKAEAQKFLTLEQYPVVHDTAAVHDYLDEHG